MLINMEEGQAGPGFKSVQRGGLVVEDAKCVIATGCNRASVHDGEGGVISRKL